MTSFRSLMGHLNPYELHKTIINEYVLKKPGDTKLLHRSKCKDKTDHHIIRENHKFLWEDNDKPDTWEEQFAKRYYEKLFREYCLADLSHYKKNKVALRWRTAKEVVSGKGQFICGNKICEEKNNLRSWEVNFVYQEKQHRKNALVKIRLCPVCSKKLNYHSRKREIKRLQQKNKCKETGDTKNPGSSSKSTDNSQLVNKSEESLNNCEDEFATPTKPAEESPWASHKPVETKSREEEMEEYLQDLLL